MSEHIDEPWFETILRMKLGYEESGSGPVLLLVHGFPVDLGIWKAQLSGLSDIRRVMAVDLRGRGKSPMSATGGWTIEDYARDIAETLDHLDVPAVDLAGLSMGGYICFAFLRMHPGRVRSLILMSTKAEEDSPEAKRGRDENATLVRERGSEALVERMFGKLVSEDAPEEVIQSVLAMFHSTPPDTAILDLIAMRDRPDFTGDLASIAAPALVVQGDRDELLKIEAGRAMAEAMPQGRFVSIPGASHFAPLEKPDLVNRALREFLPKVTTE